MVFTRMLRMFSARFLMIQRSPAVPAVWLQYEYLPRLDIALMERTFSSLGYRCLRFCIGSVVRHWRRVECRYDFTAGCRFLSEYN